MKKIDRGTFPFYTFNHLAACREISHFVSSGGKDISFLGNEEPARVVANRRELGRNAGFELDRLVVGNQVHGAEITVVTGRDAGRGAYDNESRLPYGADGRLCACAPVRPEMPGNCCRACRLAGNGGQYRGKNREAVSGTLWKRSR